eukprot:scpid62350/ scgid5608/ Acyl-coenzyme A thioesterase 8; Acyl-CoA thioesterase 8; Choloyl-coenzyme A thioesterase; Peroxisomal acyl-CoA thioesterase 2; Peroxisomal acyl-coenzyme A thioester hydrolase 1; Peroxisomal long-chain acyl-CoA thioesterase 1
MHVLQRLQCQSGWCLGFCLAHLGRFAEKEILPGRYGIAIVGIARSVQPVAFSQRLLHTNRTSYDVKEAVSPLESVLTIEEVGDNEFCASTPWTPYGQSVKHMFGGQAVGQALMAAGRTLRGEHAGKLVNSLHAYFLRAGNLTSPITYKVDCIRDGKSYSVRQVSAIQDGCPFFTSTMSFHHYEESSPLYHQVDLPQDIPMPEDLLEPSEVVERYLNDASQARLCSHISVYPSRVIDFRDGDYPRNDTAKPDKNRKVLWMKLRQQLSKANPLLHQCAMAYLSDFLISRTAFRIEAHSTHMSPLRFASLDHGLWMHSPDAVANDWLLYVLESPVAKAGRGLNTGRLYSRDGKLLASTAQEGAYRMQRL